MLVGAPGDTISGHGRAGSVTAIGVNEPTPDDDFPFSFTGQYQLLTAPTPATGAAFGTSIASPQSGLAIGAPGVHGGRVYLYRSSGPDQLPVVWQATWKQQAGRPETGDGFGSSSAGVSN